MFSFIRYLLLVDACVGLNWLLVSFYHTLIKTSFIHSFVILFHVIVKCLIAVIVCLSFTLRLNEIHEKLTVDSFETALKMKTYILGVEITSIDCFDAVGRHKEYSACKILHPLASHVGDIFGIQANLE